MKNLFDPKTGEFATNIRTIDGGDDTELRQSLQQFGWSSEFPALKDEHGVVLVGHRRLKIAEELGISPVVKTYTFGSGTAADAERLKLALVSNIGFKAMTKEDRQHIAEHLYGEREWTMEKIGKALNVSKMQISRDLANCNPPLQSKPAKTDTNPKGAGRPKGSHSKKASNSKKSGTSAPKPHDLAQEVIALHYDEGRSHAEAAKQTGVPQRQVRHILEEEAIRRKALDEVKVDPKTLSMSAQAKLELATKQAAKKLETEIEHKVRAEVQRWLTDDLLPMYRQKEATYNLIIKSRKGALSNAEYKLIWSCLHTDSRRSVSDEKLNKAFHLFTKLEKLVLDEKESPTLGSDLPKTAVELLKRKAEYDARRAAERAARRGAAANVARR